jgi:hypothetical protein
MSNTTSKTVSTRQYQASHGRSPRGYGQWMFELRGAGEIVTRTGTYTDARKALPAGNWVVLP